MSHRHHIRPPHSEPGFVRNIDRLMLFSRRHDVDFGTIRCSRFGGKGSITDFLDTPCTAYTSRARRPVRPPERHDRLRDMVGLRELYALALHIGSITGSLPFRTRAPPDVSKMPPYDTVNEPHVASLHVVFRLYRGGDLVTAEINLGGFDMRSCLHLRNSFAFLHIQEFVRACRMDVKGTIFCQSGSSPRPP